MRKTLANLLIFAMIMVVGGCGGSSGSPISSTPAAGQATLWVANSNSTMTSYSENAGSDATPNVVISNPFAATFLNPPGAGAFDSGGNLWVPNSGGNTIVEFSAAQVEQGGTPNPIITVENPSGQNFISQPSALALDSTGNLWVVNSGNPTIIEYTAQQLTSNPENQPFTFAPAAIISNPTGSAALSNPRGIAFDRAGNLWVSNGANGSTLVAYSPGQQVTGTPIPTVTITPIPIPNPAGSASIFQGIAFDKDGNLWVTLIPLGFQYASELVQYSKAQLAVSGSPIPAITISNCCNNPTGGIALDSKGNLWVANNPNYSSDVLEYAATDITQSGSPTPVVSISNPTTGAALFINSPLSVLFDSAGDLVVINNAFLNPIVEYGAAQITASGSPSPESVLNNPSGNSGLGIAAGLALDSTRLWESVKSANSSVPALGAVLAFNKSDLQHSGSPRPAIVITDPTTLPSPSGITFDSQGNLWVANTLPFNANLEQLASFVQFSAASIASGTPEPTVIITTGFSYVPNRIAFDSKGNLWVAGDPVVEYAASDLISTGSPTPAVVIPGSSGLGLGFDNSGNLWVGSSNSTPVNNALVVEFDGKSLSSSSSPIADISGPVSVLNDLQFDTATGNMWILSGNSLFQYKASTLAGGGNIVDADGVIAGPRSGLDNPTALAIQP